MLTSGCKLNPGGGVLIAYPCKNFEEDLARSVVNSSLRQTQITDTYDSIE